MALFSFVTCIISVVVFGLEFIASIIIGSKRSFGFPVFYLAVSCICGTISQAISAAAVSGAFPTRYYSLPGYWYAITFFSYVQYLMVIFLPVLAIFLLIKQCNKRISQSDIGGGHGQAPKTVIILIYAGFFFAVLAIVLLIVSMALSGNAYTMYEVITYGQITIASSMILWFFVLFWIVAAIFHKSIQLQHSSSFIGYGILITLPMIISTVSMFYPSNPFFLGWQYAIFFLNTVPLFFAVGLALIYAHRWTECPEKNGSQPI